MVLGQTWLWVSPGSVLVPLVSSGSVLVCPGPSPSPLVLPCDAPSPRPPPLGQCPEMPLPGRCTAPGLVLILALARGDQVTGVRDGVNGSGRIRDELTGPRNVAEFPPCVTDHDCGEEDGYKCFQYMCYPWNR